MSKSINDIPKKMRGRPATGKGEGVLVRLQPSDMVKFDKWIAEQSDPMTRPQALRAMMAMVIEIGLKVKANGHQPEVGQKKRAREMAGTAIDDMTDTAASPDDQASRKRRLLKGPEEFRNVRVDRPNRKR